jgi:mannose-6-phosphate isomerase-like protein (cupin superfamily)
MHVYSKAQVTSPIVTQHGETIFELLGRDFAEGTEKHSVAHILIPPGKASLLHYHPEAEESYYILSGKAHILIGEQESAISAGQIVLIPPKNLHQIRNIGEDDLEFLAICVPAWEPSNTVLAE